MSFAKYKKGYYRRTIERKKKAIQRIEERIKREKLKKKIERYNGFMSKKMKPSEQYALEILKKNNWYPQKIHGAVGLPDFVCSQNRWVEVKLGGSATIPFTQLKMLDILIQDKQKIFLLLIRNIGHTYKLFRLNATLNWVDGEIEPKKQAVYKPFEDRFIYHLYEECEKTPITPRNALLKINYLG